MKVKGEMMVTNQKHGIETNQLATIVDVEAPDVDKLMQVGKSFVLDCELERWNCV